MISERKQYWTKNSAVRFSSFLRENNLSTNAVRALGLHPQTTAKLKAGPCIIDTDTIEKARSITGIDFCTEKNERSAVDFLRDVLGKYVTCDIGFLIERCGGRVEIVVDAMSTLIVEKKVRVETKKVKGKEITLFYGV